MYPTRAEIVRLLRETGGCTLHDLVRQTGLSPSALRQQLLLLERDGLIRRALVRGRAGRPPIVYQLTSDVIPREQEDRSHG